MRIQPLPSLLANQIAAGEVIERPASVVKELVENSVDAGASRIDVEIVQAGKDSIRVRDNGGGIHQDDLLLAIQSHATSKIQSVADLAAVASLGFRGEALASIASVSKFSLSSRTDEASVAYQLSAEGRSHMIDLAPTSHPIGTSVFVNDLFFNTPARKKFLKSNNTEVGHIETLLKRFALSHFEVAFTLVSDGRTLMSLPIATTLIQREKRVAKLFGPQFLTQACSIDTEAAGMRLQGWLAAPTLSRSQTDCQYCYVNGRITRDKLINHAIRQAYDGLLYEGRHALYALYLTLDPSLVDVNVHPTKHEVRFHESRLVHDFIMTNCHQALTLPRETEECAEVAQTSFSLPKTAPTSDLVAVKAPFLNAQTVCSEPATSAQPFARQTTPMVIEALSAPTRPTKTESDTEASFGRVIGVLSGSLILCELADEMLVVNAEKAQASLITLHMKSGFAIEGVRSRRLLIPETVSIDTHAIQHLAEHGTTLQRLGFELEALGPMTVILRAVPSICEVFDAPAFLSDLAIVFNKASTEAFIELTVKHSALYPAPLSAISVKALLHRVRDHCQEAFTQRFSLDALQ